MTVFYYTFIRSLRNKHTLIVITLIPLLMILIPMLWLGKSSAGFTLYGAVILYGSFLLSRTIMTDRVNKTAVRIFSAPIRTYEYLFQSLLAYSILITMQIILIISIGSLLYDWGIVLTLKLFLCYTVFAASSIGFSIAWNSLFRSKLMSDAVFGIVISLMSIVGGIFMPVDMLPDFLKKIGMLFPTYWLSNSLISLNGNSSFNEYFLSIGILIMLTTAYIIFGSKRRLE